MVVVWILQIIMVGQLSAKGHVEVVRELLLYHGASVDFTYKECNTPLHFAAYKGHVEVF
jgi:ankyrin repeat protein